MSKPFDLLVAASRAQSEAAIDIEADSPLPFIYIIFLFPCFLLSFPSLIVD
jgi:hypothetical protein